MYLLYHVTKGLSNILIQPFFFMEQAPKKILIVDDEESIRLLYKQELEEEGYEVLLAANAYEALEIVDKEFLDLMVLDIKMPGMNGIEAMQKIVGKKNNIPIIINSSYPHFKDSFMTWVAEEYVVKSSNLQELKDKIKQLLNKPQE
jgi:Response regulator containing CheY-like receiver, AAA-type ATPase, and DNA-binding domains